MLATELSHFMFKRRRGKKGFLSLKIDMSKAYDRIEWEYLRNVLLRLIFCREWTELIMICVSTVSYAFLVNGVPRGYFHPSRGLWQGNPLLLYFFLLCVEGFPPLIANKERESLIQGLSICSSAHRINHFLFADDSFHFVRATVEPCNQIKLILHQYELFSGQMINQQKSEVSFSRNVKRNV